MKKLFILFIILAILITNVSAERFVNYNFKEGRIDANNNFQVTETNVDNVRALGFVCLNENCANLGEKIFDLNSGVNTNLQLNYPTDLKSSFGYAVYYSKEGFIPWESNPNWFGTDPTDPKGPFSIYLSKKELCSSEIQEFTIRNSEKVNTPVVVSVKADLDGSTKSAINQAGPLLAFPEELQKDYSVRTLVSLDILNEEDNSLYSDAKEILIGYGENSNIEFSFTPFVEGNYKAVVKTQVVDEKCISSEEEKQEKEFVVLEEYPQNLCYTKLSNLELDKEVLKVGEDLTLSLNKLSNLQIDKENDVIEAIPTKLNLELKDQFGDSVYLKEYFLEKNQNTVDTEKVNLVLPIPKIDSGSYELKITGLGNDVRCDFDNKEDSLYGGIIIQKDGIFNSPEIISEPITFANLGELYNYDVNAVDADGDSISYFLFGPDGMTIDENGLISWFVDPNKFKIGEEKQVVVFASDGLLFDIQFFTIQINGQIRENKKHDFRFSGLELETSNSKQGINGLLQIKNSGDFKENSVVITADIYDLGVHEILSENLNLGKRDSFWIPINLEFPSNVREGEYILNVKISSKKHTEEQQIILFVENK